MKNLDLRDFREGAKEALLKFYGLKDDQKSFELFLTLGITFFVFGIAEIFFGNKNDLWIGILLLIVGAISSVVSNVYWNRLEKVRKYMKNEINYIENAKDILSFLCTVDVIYFNKIPYFHEWIIWLSIIKPHDKMKQGELKPKRLSVFPEGHLESLGQIANYLSENGINFHIKDLSCYEDPKKFERGEQVTLIVHKDNPRKLLQLIGKGCDVEGKIKLIFEKPLI